MKAAYAVPALAVLGLAAGGLAVYDSGRPTPPAPAPVEPAAAPYPSFVAGSGIVEASTGDIAVGTPVAGIVTEIYVRLGEHVQADQPLFKIDDRDLEAQLATARASVDQSMANVQQPRDQLAYLEELKQRAPTAVTAQQLKTLRDELGAAQAALAVAKARVAQLQKEIDLRTVRARVAGRILRQQLRLGEYIGNDAASKLVLGDDSTLYVRVSIDQEDAWRFSSTAEAMALERGNPQLRIPLHFEYIEPIVVPKQTLTGRSTEQTDTRVLQVLYGFAPGNLPVYVGQQMDVYIEAPPAAADEASARGRP